MSLSDAERIRARYPRPRAHWLGIALPVTLAVVGVAWLVWAGIYHSTPAVAGRVLSWEVVSDSETRLVLTVDRPDPSVPAVCTVIAQAPNFERVAQLTVEIPPSTVTLADVPVTLRTLSRATSVSLLGCQATR